MKILYLLERSVGESEVFIRREIGEVMRQGSLVEAAHRHGAEYRVERAEMIVSLHPASSTGGAGSAPLPPAGLARAMAASASPGARRALAHARGAGRGLGSGFRQAVALARHARRFGADLIHAHFAARASADAMLASSISGIPFTFTAHGYDVHLEPPSDYPERAAAAAALITVSENNASVLVARHRVPRERIRVVHPGVDVNRFRPRGEEEPGLLLSVMRLHRDKGADLLLDAAEVLLAGGVDFRWEVYGDGEERERMEPRLAGDLGSRVKLMGWADEATLMAALARASLFVLPSRHESFIYIPNVNWLLLLAVIALVLGFRSSSNLASAYGIAVTLTMMIDTVLAFIVVRALWKWNWLQAASFLAFFVIVDFAFFSANIVKVMDGGWFPLLLGVGIFTVLATWRKGRILLAGRLQKDSMPLDAFLSSLNYGGPHRVEGTGIFLTTNPDGVPRAMLHNLLHNKVLHERVIMLNVSVEDVPHVPDIDQIEITKLEHGFFHMIVRYGFKDDPNIPRVLQLCEGYGMEPVEMMETSFFLGRETIIPNRMPSMPLWRQVIFMWMFRNADTASAYFKIPTNRVVELGTQVEL